MFFLRNLFSTLDCHMLVRYQICFFEVTYLKFYYPLGEYHKYDTVVYPKKTQVSKSLKETISDTVSGIFSRIFRSKPSGDSKEEEELVPMGVYDMSIFCLQCYLGEYKDMVCEGKFQQGADISLEVNKVAHIISSLSSFSLRTTGDHGHTFLTQVPNLNKYREVCSYIPIFSY